MLFYLVTQNSKPPAGKIDRRRLRTILPNTAEGYVWALDGHTLIREGVDSAVLNAAPYRRPFPVTAAGGYVLRRRNNRFEVALIHRRGEWDLPKGKADKGEGPELTAIREVCEELGIDNISVIGSLGTTTHGYREKKRFAVKTTHWFAMTTESEQLFPEAAEGIQRAEWVGWEEALRRLGFETLRAHARGVRPQQLLP